MMSYDDRVPRGWVIGVGAAGTWSATNGDKILNGVAPIAGEEVDAALDAIKAAASGSMSVSDSRDNRADSGATGPLSPLCGEADHRDRDLPHNAGVVGSSPTPAIVGQQLTSSPADLGRDAAPRMAP